MCGYQARKTIGALALTIEPAPAAADDCFRTPGGVIRHASAIAILKERIKPIAGTELVDLPAAAGRILAEPAVASFPVPLHTNSAVDGFAFAASGFNFASGGALPLSGEAKAGHPMTGTPPSGHAVRILTGAVVPAGLDTVAMQEDCQVEAADAGRSMVRIPAGLKAHANVRRAGEDVEQGTQLFPAGHSLRPQDLAALASIGMGSVVCRSRLKVAIVSTGDEVRRAGSTVLEPGQVFDANAPMLTALIASAGCETTDLGIWPDDRAEVERRLAALAGRFDAVLTSGGASKGSEDHMAASLGALGSRHFWEIGVKPGRPMMFGNLGSTIVVGLPGNPVAVFVCFLMYVFPMLHALGGARWPEPRRFALPAAFSVRGRKQGRREFWRGMLVERDGGMAVDKFARDGSGLISGLRAADGLIDCPEDRPSVEKGELVDYIPFSEFGIQIA